MKNKLTPEQLERIRKKHDHKEDGFYDCTMGDVTRAAQTPEGWKEQGK